MGRRIAKITFLPEKTKSFSCEFGEKCNFVIGHTETNKTLIFKLIEYLLGGPKDQIKPSARELYPETESFKIEFDDGSYIERPWPYDKKSTTIRFPEGQIKSIDNQQSFKKELSNLLRFKLAEVQSGSKVTSMTYVEAMSYINVPESTVSSQESIINQKGYGDMQKRIGFLKYLVTGVQIDKKVIKEQTAAKRTEKRIVEWRKAINACYKFGKKEMAAYKEALTSLSKAENAMSVAQEAYRKSKNERRRLLLERSRIQQLLELYSASSEEEELGIVLARFNQDTNLDELDLVDIEVAQDLISKQNQIKETLQSLDKELSEKQRAEKQAEESCQKAIEEVNRFKETLQIYKQVEQFQNANRMADEMGKIASEATAKTDTEIKVGEGKVDHEFAPSITAVCDKATSIISEVLGTKKHITYSLKKNDFFFEGKETSIAAKGYKALIGFSIGLALLLCARKNGVINTDFIIVDSLWPGTDLDNLTPSLIAQRIENIAERESVQIIVFENGTNLPRNAVRKARWIDAYGV